MISDKNSGKSTVSNKYIKTLWVREPYLAQILDGRKTIEVRVGYDNIRRLQPGDRLKLNDQHIAIIRRIGRYDNFEELLAHESLAAIAPDLVSASGQGALADELLATLRQIYPPEKEALGAVALELHVRRYDAILFDMGYTLITFEPAQEIIVQEILREFGAERSVDEINAAAQVVWGAYYRDAATEAFPATLEYDRETQVVLAKGLLSQLGLATEGDVLQVYIDSIESRFQQPGVIRPYAEVVDVLDTLRDEGYRLGIVSNWSWNLRDRVAQVELDGYFEVVWASAYAGCNKPHPDVFHQAMAQMAAPELDPGRVLYVGDSYEHDVAGARNAGIDAVLLDRHGTAANPDCPVIRDLRGLFDLLGE
jgi:putative hydrolase of the HAD superfamily